MTTRGNWYKGGITLAVIVLGVILAGTHTAPVLAHRVPTSTATASTKTGSTATTRPIKTATPQPRKANTILPTATATTSALAHVDPALLGTCTAAIHDRYTVVGPDGQVYRTWHPQVVPIDPYNPAAGNCRFAHEHGDDPRTSLANSSLPPFGYIGSLVNDAEPHEGFKVFVINQGAQNNEGGVAQNSTRIVFHMGTDGAKRFDTRFHSLMFDLAAPDGHYVHVHGMADTGGLGSICANPRQGRTVVVTAGCPLTSLYEIWAIALNLGGRATINTSVGVFDPITVLDPNSLPGQRPLIYTASALPQFGPAQYDCDREAYAGPIYWYNGGRPTTFYTDAYGNLAASGLQQRVSANDTLGIRMTSLDFYQMKLRRSQCASGLGVKN